MHTNTRACGHPAPYGPSTWGWPSGLLVQLCARQSARHIMDDDELAADVPFHALRSLVALKFRRACATIFNGRTSTIAMNKDASSMMTQW